MKRAFWFTLTVAVNAILVTASLAQINSWISPSDGKWEKVKNWDAGLPSATQSAVIISNVNSKVVTIDEHTARKFPNSLTISNLAIYSSSGDTNTLYLDNTGTIALHILDGLTVDADASSVSMLISTNSALIVDGMLGGQLDINDGTVEIIGSSLVVTNSALLVGASDFVVGILTVSNGGIVHAEEVVVGNGESTSGTIQLIGSTMILSSTLTVGSGFNSSSGLVVITDGGLLVVTNASTAVGNLGMASSGSITVSNATMLASDMGIGTGFQSDGLLIIDDGTVTLDGSLSLGFGSSFGSISLNGGFLTVTNADTSIGQYQGNGSITIVDGRFLARSIFVGVDFASSGFLTIAGGTTQLNGNLQVGQITAVTDTSGALVNGGQLIVTNGFISVDSQIPEPYCDPPSDCFIPQSINISNGQLMAKTISLARNGDPDQDGGLLFVTAGITTVSEGITLGDCAANMIGYVWMNGGELIVTNSMGTGFIDVQNGQIVLSNGVLQVDKLVMTNSCSQFIHTGGTLIVGSVILDPNAFRITSVTRQGNDLNITWLMAPGQTNALQASAGGPQGSYTTNGFTDIFIVTNNTTTAALTNYLDLGAATNQPARYYRARLSP